jgi:YidC/Oxa1 family membrane protein insertase
MDKRSLIFVICITMAYFGVHTAFGYWNDSKKQTVVVTQPASNVAAIPSVPVTQVAPQSVPKMSSGMSSGSEDFYVLENDYQQLVFSTRGGALAEINLPLKNNDPLSIVKEIDIDRQIVKTSPQNALFPLNAYHIVQDSSTTLKENGAKGGFYPLLRRSLISPNGTVKNPADPEFYALNILGDDIDTYNVKSFGQDFITFEGSNGKRTITKTFTVPATQNGPYCFNVDIKVDGDATGLWLSSGIPDVELVGGAYAPQLKYQVKVAGGADVEEIKLPKEGVAQNLAVSPYWISNCNGFLGVIMDPLTPMGTGFETLKVDGNVLPTRLSLIDSAHNLYPAANYPGYATLLPLPSGSSSVRVFAGPYDEALLKKIDALYSNPLENYNPEYSLAISIQGWFSFISQPFSKFLFLLMQLFYAVTHSWAVSIVLLTIALRAMMFPLNNWSIKSTVKMQEIAPRVKAIQDKHKKDPKKGQMEVMSLYKEMGVNPFSGCLPMLLQMPFLIGMFYMLKSSFPLRGAPFIGGWINDLAAPDVLFSWSQPYWIIGNEFHLLPILTGLVMFVQGKMTQKVPKDPSQLTDAEKQQKMMGTMMSVVFTLMFYSFPSGLNIYFMFSTLLGIGQQALIAKRLKTKMAAKGPTIIKRSK